MRFYGIGVNGVDLRNPQELRKRSHRLRQRDDCRCGRWALAWDRAQPFGDCGYGGRIAGIAHPLGKFSVLEEHDGWLDIRREMFEQERQALLSPARFRPRLIDKCYTHGCAFA
jgi:hypothetical protein